MFTSYITIYYSLAFMSYIVIIMFIFFYMCADWHVGICIKKYIFFWKFILNSIIRLNMILTLFILGDLLREGFNKSHLHTKPDTIVSCFSWLCCITFSWQNLAYTETLTNPPHTQDLIFSCIVFIWYSGFLHQLRLSRNMAGKVTKN